MLKRKIENEIQDWIKNDDKALLIYGVRQVGKTYTIRKCLKDAECNYVEFNLIEQPELVDIINNSTSTNDLILKISLYSEKQIVAGKTFIFFDEIQKCKDIVTKIKFLVDDKRFRYILSGSLLDVEITNLKSAPVGYLRTITMYPLDFEEFLQVFNVSDEVINTLHSSYLLQKPVDNYIHNKIMEIFNLYLIVGGMPAAVEKYRTTSDIDAVMSEHNSIIEQYKLDFTQYENEDKKLLISHIYELIPAELNEKNKRFKVSDINKNLRYERVNDSFTWLWKSGVALGTFNTTEPTVPLMLNEKSSLLKMFLSDVGLLTTIYGKNCKLKIVNNDKDINKGAIYENVVAQELCCHGYPLYYYNNKKNGEIDFLIEHNGKVLPIEVKSGKNYEKHSALDNIMKAKEYDIKEAYVFTNDNLKKEDNVIYLPIYMVMFVKEELDEFVDISLDKYMFK